MVTGTWGRRIGVLAGISCAAAVLVGCASGGVGDLESPTPPAETSATPFASSESPTARSTPTPTRSSVEAPGTPQAPTDRAASSQQGVVVTVTKIIDGDTIDTTAGRIRLIGIDTPERGDCNYGAASDELAGMISAQNDQVVLVRGGTDDTDRYDRLLRYVDTIGGQDLNFHMITSGYAVARYDSRDGYGPHDREDSYIAADQTSAPKPCPGSEAAPASVASFQPQPQPQPQQLQQFAAGVEPWDVPGPDLDCSDIGKMVILKGPDYHNIDGDGDGIGCERYG